MNPADSNWQKLVAAARCARDDRDTSAPYGFATRVAALGLARPRVSLAGALFDRFSWKAVGIAGLLALVGLVANYSALNAQTDDDGLSDEGTVAALLDVS